MTANLGSADRIVRVLLGIILVALPFVSNLAIFASGVWTAVAVVVGIVLIATAAMKFCPLYRIFGIRTCRI